MRQQLVQQWNRTPEGKRHPARLVELPGDADQQPDDSLDTSPAKILKGK